MRREQTVEHRRVDDLGAGLGELGAHHHRDRSADEEEEGDAEIETRESKGGSVIERSNRTGLISPVRESEEQITATPASEGWKVTKKSTSERPVGRWVARKKAEPVDGPAFPEMVVARNDRVK